MDLTPGTPIADTLPHLRPRRGGAREAPSLELIAHGATALGQREVNEDQFVVAELSRELHIHQCGLEGFEPRDIAGAQGWLLAVADGLGGHGNGDLASSVALDAIVAYAAAEMPWLGRSDSEHHSQVLAALDAALHLCQRKVFETAAAKGVGANKPGTTVTMLYAASELAYLAHAGDSRAYLVRGGRLYQMTRDHTLAEELARAQHIPVEQVAVPRFHHVLSNAVGAGEDKLRADVTCVQLHAGDRLLLCTDGLSNMIDSDELAIEISSASPVSEISERLVKSAVDRGGSDNITAIVAEVRST